MGASLVFSLLLASSSSSADPDSGPTDAASDAPAESEQRGEWRPLPAALILASAAPGTVINIALGLWGHQAAQRSYGSYALHADLHWSVPRAFFPLLIAASISGVIPVALSAALVSVLWSSPTEAAITAASACAAVGGGVLSGLAVLYGARVVRRGEPIYIGRDYLSTTQESLAITVVTGQIILAPLAVGSLTAFGTLAGATLMKMSTASGHGARNAGSE